MAISAEEFARWRDDTVTQWVFAALAKNATECRDEWIAATWDHSNLNPLLLKELQTRADANRALIDTSYEDFCQALGMDPLYDDR